MRILLLGSSVLWFASLAPSRSLGRMHTRGAALAAAATLALPRTARKPAASRTSTCVALALTSGNVTRPSKPAVRVSRRRRASGADALSSGDVPQQAIVPAPQSAVSDARGEAPSQPVVPAKTTSASSADSASATKEPKRRRKADSISLAPPAGWRETYTLIEELRADRTAVVDAMGSEALAQLSSPHERNFHTLVSLMLSSQTKDTVNAATMTKLRARGLSPQALVEMPDAELDEIIYSVGFHNNKVKYLKQASQLLIEQHGGRVPDTMDALLALPGVGPKMALIVLRVAFGKVEGISVDTHVHRIANQLGWTGPSSTKTPEQTRHALEGWMPREIWPDVNLLIVGFGQELQTEKPKLLTKALNCSRPQRALALLGQCGMKVEKELARHNLEAPVGDDPSPPIAMTDRRLA